MAMRTIIYRRVSSDEQKKNNSPSAQHTDGISYAEQHGMSIIDSLLEDFTGITIDRPVFNRLLELADAGMVDAVIVQHPDRLGRGPILELAIALLTRRGVQVHACNRGLISDGDDETSQFQNSVDGLVSGVERRNIKHRTQRGLLEKVTVKGKISGCGSAPYGYTWQGHRSERTLVIAEVEARVVKLIFEWYVGGDSVLMICKRLEAMDLPSPSFSNDNKKQKLKDVHHWGRGSVHRILRRRTYMGEFVAFGNIYRKEHSNPISPTPIILPVPAIISAELFEETQAKLDKGRERSAWTNKKYFYLLRSVSRCPCGRKIAGHDRGRYYQCSAVMHPHDAVEVCANGSFRVRDTDHTVWAWLEEHVLTEENLLEGIQYTQGSVSDQRRKLEDEQTYYHQRLEVIDTEVERLRVLFTSGIYTLEEIGKAKQRFDSDRAEFEGRIADVTLRLRKTGISPEATQQLLTTVRAIQQKDTQFSNKEKREVVELLEIKVVMYKCEGKPWVHIDVGLTLQEADFPIVPQLS
jgi:DNA invertase Pin-like site-specific DNA recombinase